MIANDIGLKLHERYDLEAAARIIDCGETEVIKLVQDHRLPKLNTPSRGFKFLGLHLLRFLCDDAGMSNASSATNKSLSPTIDKIFNSHEVISIVGLSRSSIDREERKNNFPKRIQLTSRRVGWRQSEVLEWLNTRKRVSE